MLNLLSNALKYSPPDASVTVRVRPLQGAVEVAVVDRGEGITAEQAAHVFDRFCRAKVGGTRKRPEGLGLGLFICRQIVEAHGGTIEAESELGLGSTFRFTLPTLERWREERPSS